MGDAQLAEAMVHPTAPLLSVAALTRALPPDPVALTCAALEWRHTMVARLLAVDYGAPGVAGQTPLAAFTLDSSLPYTLAADLLSNVVLALAAVAAVAAVAGEDSKQSATSVAKLRHVATEVDAMACSLREGAAAVLLGGLAWDP